MNGRGSLLLAALQRYVKRMLGEPCEEELSARYRNTPRLDRMIGEMEKKPCANSSMGSRETEKDSGTGKSRPLSLPGTDPRMVWRCFAGAASCYVLGKEENGSFQGIAGGSSVRDTFGFLRVRHDSGRGNFPVRLRQNLSVVLRRLTQWFYLSNGAAVIGKRGNRI